MYNVVAIFVQGHMPVVLNVYIPVLLGTLLIVLRLLYLSVIVMYLHYVSYVMLCNCDELTSQ